MVFIEVGGESAVAVGEEELVGLIGFGGGRSENVRHPVSIEVGQIQDTVVLLVDSLVQSH